MCVVRIQGKPEELPDSRHRGRVPSSRKIPQRRRKITPAPPAIRHWSRKR